MNENPTTVTYTDLVILTPCPEVCHGSTTMFLAIGDLEGLSIVRKRSVGTLNLTIKLPTQRKGDKA